MTNSSYVRLLLTYLKPRWKQAVGLLLLLLFVIGLQLYGPIVLSRFIDAAVGGESLGILLQISALFLGIAVVTQLISLFETYVAENLGMMATNQLRADIALHCMKLDISFHNSHTPGELIEGVDGDVAALGNFFSRFAVRLVGNSLLVIAVLIYLTQVDLWLTAMLTVMTVIGLLIMMRLRDVAVPFWKALRQAVAELFWLFGRTAWRHRRPAYQWCCYLCRGPTTGTQPSASEERATSPMSSVRCL